jgi:hypothetical protein
LLLTYHNSAVPVAPQGDSAVCITKISRWAVNNELVKRRELGLTRSDDGEKVQCKKVE